MTLYGTCAVLHSMLLPKQYPLHTFPSCLKFRGIFFHLQEGKLKLNTWNNTKQVKDLKAGHMY